MTFEITLKDFPDWAIPMTRVTPVYKTDNPDLFNDNEYVLVPIFIYWFKKINDSDYLLKIFVAGTLSHTVPFFNAPLYVDINLYLINERIYNTFQNDSKV